MNLSKHKEKAYRKGERAEQIAALFLTFKGYRVIERRYKTKVGEIDLIAVKGDTVIFIEVKARETLKGGLYAVTPVAQKRIARAARLYLQRKRKLQSYDCRFDLIVMRYGFWPYHLKHCWNTE